ncbi:stabilin-2 isoform X5 [Danio rerio]|uniref:Stabilin-2 isoform X5 n=1 Tax=Danio rerio TaxID=7955 RepID=A0AB32TN64_DANRE
MDVCCGQSIDLLKRTPENTRIMRYHIVCCRTLLPQDLMQPRNLTTLSGDILSITYSEDTIYINNKAKVLFSDIESSNGTLLVRLLVIMTVSIL